MQPESDSMNKGYYNQVSTPAHLSQQRDIETEVDQIRERLFPCLATNYRDKRDYRGKTIYIEKHDGEAVKSLKDVLNLLKKDLPQKGDKPQRIGTLEQRNMVETGSLRVPVTTFTQEAEYPEDMTHIVPSVAVPVIGFMCDGKIKNLKRLEVAKFDPQGLVGLDKVFSPAAKGTKLETPLFCWLQKHIKEKDTQSQISLIQDRNVYSNYNYRILSASVDGLIYLNDAKRGCLEIKTTGNLYSGEFLQPLGAGFELQAGHNYWTQIQAYLHIMDLEFCMLFVYSWTTEQYVCVDVPKDTGRFNRMYKRFVSKEYLKWILDEIYITDKEKTNQMTIRTTKPVFDELNELICDGIDMKTQQYVLNRNRRGG